MAKKSEKIKKESPKIIYEPVLELTGKESEEIVRQLIKILIEIVKNEK